MTTSPTSAPTPEDAIRSIKRLRRVLEAAKLLNSTLDLSELTAIILRIVRDEIGTDRGTVFVLERNSKHLRSLVAEGVEGFEIVVPLGQGVAGTVAATGEVVNISDAYRDPRFDPSFDAQLGYRTQDIYCMPIVNRVGTVVGVLELLNRGHGLSEEDEAFLAGVSVHMGVALQNAQMHREIMDKRRLERELVLAREIQRKFYPNVPPTYAGVAIRASCEMCEAVGGDYLRYFPIEERRFLVAVGDVAGKGIGAALITSSLHATCRALVRHVHALENMAGDLNETFYDSTDPAVFITMLLMLVDPVDRRVHLIRAGHNPPLAVNSAGQSMLFESGGGFPLGLFPHVHYQREIFDVEPGTVLVLYTDGVTEAENGRDEQFGVERLIEVVSRDRARTAQQIHTGILAALADFIGEEPAHDDATLLVLKFA